MSIFTKAEGGARVRAPLDREPHVLTYDEAFMDEGRYMLTLTPGWAFYDAATRTEDDPEGRHASHSLGFSTIRSGVKAARSAERCRCGRCMRLNPNLKPL